MASRPNLVLERWLPVLDPEATRTPSGRVARVMTFYLSCGKGKDNARHWMEYVSEVEPEALDRIRIGLALAPSGQEQEFSGRELSLLRRRVRAALTTARKRWGLPLVEVEEDVFYADVKDGSGAPAAQDAPRDESRKGVFLSANAEAKGRWGFAPRVVQGGGKGGDGCSSVRPVDSP